jgi:hypothetical protein
MQFHTLCSSVLTNHVAARGYRIATSNTNKAEGNVHPSTRHEGPDVEQRYIYILSLTSALDGGG